MADAGRSREGSLTRYPQASAVDATALLRSLARAVEGGCPIYLSVIWLVATTCKIQVVK